MLTLKDFQGIVCVFMISQNSRFFDEGVSVLYCWSIFAFSILLSLARLFWNHILICVSVRSNASASSNLLGLEMYSFLVYSTSNLRVWSEVKVVLCLL